MVKTSRGRNYDEARRSVNPYKNTNMSALLEGLAKECGRIDGVLSQRRSAEDEFEVRFKRFYG